MNHILKMMVMFIVSVAVYDIYCTVALHDSVFNCEENPVALWFVRRHDHVLHTTHPSDPNKTVRVRFSTPDVSQLVAAKSAGLCCSMSAMRWLIDSMPRIAGYVIVPIFGSAIWLLARLVH